MGLIHQNRKCLIAWHYNTFPHAEAVIQVAKEIKSEGIEPIILDLTKYLPFQKKSLTQFLLYMFDRYHPYSPLETLRLEAENNSIRVESPRLNRRFELFKKTLLMQLKLRGNAKELEIDPNSGGLGPALASDLVTLIAFDEFAKPSRNPIDVHRSIRSFLVSEILTTGTIVTLEIDSVAVFNGRLCSHAGVWEAAKKLNMNVRFHEVGAGKYFFLENFRPHNRELFQKKSKQLFTSLSTEEKESLAIGFRSRRTQLSANRFLELQLPSKGEEISIQPEENLAVIYTSSPEELVGVGANWENSGWDNQYYAIRQTAKRLDALGYKIVIRIHPNIANKSWHEFNRAMRAFRDLPHLVLLPYDQINSYDLLDKASIVIVWRSTIGLEASALGKPTFCLNPTRYDETADIRKISTSAILKTENFEKYQVDASRAMPSILWSSILGFTVRRSLSPNWFQKLEKFHSQRRYILRLNRILVPVENLIDIKKRPTNLFRFLRKLVGNDTAQNFIRFLYGYKSQQSALIEYSSDV